DVDRGADEHVRRGGDAQAPQGLGRLLVGLQRAGGGDHLHHVQVAVGVDAGLHLEHGGDIDAGGGEVGGRGLAGALQVGVHVAVGGVGLAAQGQDAGGGKQQERAFHCWQS